MKFDTKLANELGKNYYHNRNDASFEPLYNFYNPFFSNYLSKNFSNINKAEYEFIASNVWLRIIRLIGSFNPEKRFDTWIISVIRNEAIAVLTGHSKTSRSLNVPKTNISIVMTGTGYDSEEYNDRKQIDFEDPTELTDVEERFSEVEENIYKMEYPYGIFLIAFYVYNLSHVQIGKIFGLSKEKVNQSLYSAKEYIRIGMIKGRRIDMLNIWSIEKKRVMTIWNSIDKKELTGKPPPQERRRLERRRLAQIKRRKQLKLANGN
jgi:RNA polymerase sigma factor (sigma-70 family)